MTQFAWVEDEVVLAIHDEQLSEHGGLSGIRDMGAVLSSLARPRNLFAYDDGVDLAQLAAAYIYGIVKNHGFADVRIPRMPVTQSTRCRSPIPRDGGQVVAK